MKARCRSLVALMLSAVVWLILFEPGERIDAAKPEDQLQLTITVRVEETAGLSSSLTINSTALTRDFKHANWQPLAAKPVTYPDIEVTLTQRGSTAAYRLTEDGKLWNEEHRQLLALPSKAAQQVTALAQTVRGQYYGRKLPWEEAKRSIPNKSIFTVTDLQTGLSFRVQRRAGSDHADVQPIANEDTRIMKQIFDGEWTWKRRAILVRTDQEWIAASMNGMPHGGDGIPDNDFSGHFCIHFYLSTTHKSETPDLAHQLMVHKASGELRSYLDAADPALLARSYIEALIHRDRTIMRQVAFGMQDEQINDIIARMDALDSIRDTTNRKRGSAAQSKPGGDDKWAQQLTAQVSLPVTYRMKGEAQRNTMFHFTFSRSAAAAPWRLQEIQIGRNPANERSA